MSSTNPGPSWKPLAGNAWRNCVKNPKIYPSWSRSSEGWTNGNRAGNEFAWGKLYGFNFSFPFISGNLRAQRRPAGPVGMANFQAGLFRLPHSRLCVWRPPHSARVVQAVRGVRGGQRLWADWIPTGKLIDWLFNRFKTNLLIFNLFLTIQIYWFF